MSLSDKSDTYDRLFERLANAEGYLRTARIDLQRLEIPDCAGAIEGCIAKVREVSDALVRSEAAREGRL